jgi:hypothetical protein
MRKLWILLGVGAITLAGLAVSAPVAQADSALPDPPSPKPPAAPYAAGQSLAYVNGNGVWANDWCHYYVDGGVTYGDRCLTGATSAETGKKLPNRYILNVYDPNAPRNLGKKVMSIYTGQPGWAIYRDWTDPRFQNFPDIVWMKHPAKDSEVNANNFFVYMRDGRKYTVAQITAMAGPTTSGGTGTPSGGSGGGAGKPPGLPAWDPAFSGPNALAMKLQSNAKTGAALGMGSGLAAWNNVPGFDKPPPPGSSRYDG